MNMFYQSTLRPFAIASTLSALAATAFAGDKLYETPEGSARSFLFGDRGGYSQKGYRVTQLSSRWTVVSSRVMTGSDRQRQALLEKYAGRLSEKDEAIVRQLMGVLSSPSGAPSKQLFYDSYGV